jgi:hypothetical protein
MIMRKFKFYKDDLGWFIDLPEWKGEKWELQMVSGADKFLEILSQGESEIFIHLSSEDFPNSNCLRFMEYGKMGGPEMGTGAWYFLTEYKGNEYFLEMWLCDVTKFIFGDFPKVIYFC